jgi:beta-lactamase regulating signal transducer with metallopeptidase domain
LIPALEITVVNLLHGLVQGIALAAFVALSLKLIPRLNAATRYAVWLIATLGVLVLLLRPAFIPQASKNSGDAVSTVADSSKSFIAIGPSAGRRTFPIHIPSQPLIATIIVVWSFVSTTLLIRLGVGWHCLRKIKSGASPAPEHWQLRFNRLSSGRNRRGDIRLLVSNEVAGPMALGLFAPAIVLPCTFSDQLTEDTFDQIILHELSHLRRFDDWANFLQRLIASILPIQPAFFWIGRQLIFEREIACDDHVVAVTGNPKSYAASLTRIAELSRWSRCLSLANGSNGDPSQLYRRVQRLLGKRRSTRANMAMTPVVLALAAVLIWIKGSQYAPQLFAFSEAMPSLIDSSLIADADSSEPGRQSRSFSVRAGDKLIADIDFGNIRTKTWEHNVVQIVVSRKGPHLAEFLMYHQIAMTQDEKGVRLRASSADATSGSRIVEVDYRISVPKKFDLSLRNGAGNIAVADIAGKIVVATGAGSITISNVSGSGDGHAGAGGIVAIGCQGKVLATVGPGEGELKQISRSSVEAIAG